MTYYMTPYGWMVCKRNGRRLALFATEEEAMEFIRMRKESEECNN